MKKTMAAKVVGPGTVPNANCVAIMAPTDRD